jgi:protein-L-isoaspartate(D-aspartate) O-methyltransferase
MDREELLMTDYAEQRRAMVEAIRSYGFNDERILSVMDRIERHRFYPELYLRGCDPYADHPNAIGYGQTISQPYIVAYMTALLDVRQGNRVLEIGAGSAYQAAVLAELGAEVVSMEIQPELAKMAAETLDQLGYKNVTVINGDGYKGCMERAPFDRIIAACSPPGVPEALEEQLADNGRMVIPAGESSQYLYVVTKSGGRIQRRRDIGVIFVPMVPSEKIAGKK